MSQKTCYFVEKTCFNQLLGLTAGHFFIKVFMSFKIVLLVDAVFLMSVLIDCLGLYCKIWGKRIKMNCSYSVM